MEEKLRCTSRKFRQKYHKAKAKQCEKELLRELWSSNDKSWLWEFSKKILFILTVLYCMERVYAMVVIALIRDISYLGTFLETGADVFKAGVIFYALKAGVENVMKITSKRTDPDSLVEPDGEELEVMEP